MNTCICLTDIPIRLQGPSRANGTGRVETFYNGEWGTVCDDSWDIKDAEVVCRQLGYKYAIRAIQSGGASVGSGPIWLDDMKCTGNEESLRLCSHSGWGIENCGHSEDAGVECANTGLFYVKRVYIDTYLLGEKQTTTFILITRFF